MADLSRISEGQFQLTPAMINILIALVDGEKHSFGIKLKIEDFTDSMVKMGPGTLFSSLKRMLEAGLVEQSDERIDPDLDDQIRRYYRTTGLGQRSLHKELRQRSSQGGVTQVKDLRGSSIVGGAR